MYETRRMGALQTMEKKEPKIQEIQRMLDEEIKVGGCCV